ncbi:hypothetical protein MMC31_007855 [Peltigera leucophlebia]|nr:hypothetical protein [Peltigera leucophlebia]
MNHIQIDLDPNEQTAARYRLYARVIRVIGMSQISELQLFLQAKLEETSIEEIDTQSTVDGWTPVNLAPLMRKSASGMLGVYFFGEKLCF